MEKLNIGILGLGTVGSAVNHLIVQNRASIAERTGIELRVVKAADLSPKAKHQFLVKDANEVIEDPNVHVVIETIGGVEPALSYILSAIGHGKHVVTSNKEVVALHGDEILSLAAKNGVVVRFEASVGGGIPIIGPLTEDLQANNITEVYGIVNGTTNYILTKMSREKSEFKDALLEAQQNGYAEANPKLDVEGYDASYKAVILAEAAFGFKVYWKDVYFEGIDKISLEDIRYAEEIGYVIKLLAIAKKNNNQIEVRVHPTLLPVGHPLSYISGPMNAICVRGDAVGEIMFYGQGAGGAPTASAVVGDIIKIAKCQRSQLLNLKPAKMRDVSEISGRYYIRLSVPDKFGILAGISKVFADEKVSIAEVVQKEMVNENATLVIIAHETRDSNLRKAIERLKALSVVNEVNNVIRVGL